VTTRDTLRGPPFECPECGEAYVRLGRHWGSTCDPALSEHQRSVLAGLALSGSTVDGGSVIVQTTTRPLIEWTVEQLGWLAGTLTRVEDDTDNREPIYRLSTPKHWGVERYEGWSSNGPPAEYELDATAARVWWAYAGGLEWHGEYDSQRTATISAEADDRAAWVLRVLETAGVDATRVGKRVQWHGDQLREWLEWIGKPAPGAEHKWADSLLDWRLATTDTTAASDKRTLRNTTALEIARERTSAELTPGKFDAQIDAVDADDVADWLGGGDWDDALSVAGVSRVGEDKLAKSQFSRDGLRRGRDTRYDRDDCIRALRKAAAELGEPLGQTEFEQWAAGSNDRPSRPTIARHLGSWLEACSDAGVKTRGDRLTYADFVDALATLRDDLGEWPTVEQYDELRPNGAPSSAWVYRADKHENWQHAIELAKERFGPTDTE